MKMLEELKKDFLHASENIDPDGYDPFSRKFIEALFIGQMWQILHGMKEVSGDIFSDIEEEFDGAKKYYKIYEETGDNSYKEMSADEIRHAGILIKKSLAKTTDAETKRKLNLYEEKRQSIERMVEKSVSVSSKAQEA